MLRHAHPQRLHLWTPRFTGSSSAPPYSAAADGQSRWGRNAVSEDRAGVDLRRHSDLASVSATPIARRREAGAGAAAATGGGADAARNRRRPTGRRPGLWLVPGDEVSGFLREGVIDDLLDIFDFDETERASFRARQKCFLIWRQDEWVTRASCDQD